MVNNSYICIVFILMWMLMRKQKGDVYMAKVSTWRFVLKCSNVSKHIVC